MASPFSGHKYWHTTHINVSVWTLCAFNHYISKQITHSFDWREIGFQVHFFNFRTHGRPLFVDGVKTVTINPLLTPWGQKNQNFRHKFDAIKLRPNLSSCEWYLFPSFLGWPIWASTVMSRLGLCIKFVGSIHDTTFDPVNALGATGGPKCLNKSTWSTPQVFLLDRKLTISKPNN